MIQSTRRGLVMSLKLKLASSNDLLCSGTRARVEATATGSTLSIYNATTADAGVFECMANNGIPRGSPIEVRQKLYLLVHRK